ncbi:MAG: AMP-binding protein, partial [Chloroflexi bacterium]|nr:AMP-binding protein [Chloroflexota bacterium]
MSAEQPAEQPAGSPPSEPPSEPSSAPEIENLMPGGQIFPPSAAFVAQANGTAQLYLDADEDFEAFWAKLAREKLTWRTPFKTTLEWDLPFAKWFTGGTLNVSENCIDRHVANGLGDKVAYHWIGEPGDTRTITYADLLREVSRTANALKELGVGTGDRVAIYMPMIPELPIAMLACARLGAPHTVIFGGFSAESLQGRIEDTTAKLLITADGGWRRGKPVDLKDAADEAVAMSPTIEHVLVVRRLGDAQATPMTEGRDVWWHDIVDRQSDVCPAVPVDSEHMLYLLYTSGTTAHPKGIIHT